MNSRVSQRTMAHHDATLVITDVATKNTLSVAREGCTCLLKKLFKVDSDEKLFESKKPFFGGDFPSLQELLTAKTAHGAGQLGLTNRQCCDTNKLRQKSSRKFMCRLLLTAISHQGVEASRVLAFYSFLLIRGGLTVAVEKAEKVEKVKVEEVLLLDGETLTIEQVKVVARNGARVALADAARERVKESRQAVESILLEEKPVYGVNTGCGKLSDVSISSEHTSTFQHNIVMSHAGGVGDPLPQEVVRAMMLLRANSLAKGCSGVRLETVELLLEMLNKNLHPVVPSKGSVGASGDLVPLAHIALAMIGLGEAEYAGQVLPAREALRRAQLTPIALSAKEGLALINGTQYMSALGCLAVDDAQLLMKTGLIASALAFEALEGIPAAYNPRLHDVRPHPGQRSCARGMLRLLEGSDLLKEGRRSRRVQDAYTLRCIPQVYGASLDALAHVRSVLEREINSATDNPLIFPDGKEVISGGNFHGQPLALVLDYLALAVAELGSITERRIERLVNSVLSGLPPFLVKNSGLNSGLMILQYVAASLVSENKVLAHPASVDSIPTSANQEDHVSMGSIAARKLRSIVENVTWVVAGEVFAACQALDFKEHRFGTGTSRAYRHVRRHLPHWETDRILYKDLQAAYNLVKSGSVVAVVEEDIGPLC